MEIEEKDKVKHANKDKENTIYGDFRSLGFLFLFTVLTATILSLVDFSVLSNAKWLLSLLFVADLILLIFILLVHRNFITITGFIITEQLKEMFIPKKRNKERFLKKINKWNRKQKSYIKDAKELKELIPKLIGLTLIYYLLIFTILFDPSALTGYGAYFTVMYWAFILLYAFVFLFIMRLFNKHPLISGGIFWGLNGLSVFGLKVLNPIPLSLLLYIAGKKSSEMNDAIISIMQKTLIAKFIFAVLNVVSVIGIIVYSFRNAMNFNFSPDLIVFKEQSAEDNKKEFRGTDNQINKEE
ncbi:MAG: hypothetical protein K9W45_02045 [Candidatus Heimdallarchaeum aukensis]|uniref:Uncharacterized protein n=1 Tax=Candidatus Heimdallarchaeum aukensis TaxID=2876573 RepID=A0A9Y1BM39_9ARCH|nr:MAG: hypothetical protein K9W45_02045 [Candidatus Heimdallarchaeum aukensis]